MEPVPNITKKAGPLYSFLLHGEKVFWDFKYRVRYSKIHSLYFVTILYCTNAGIRR
jgi:hypothetical protein